MLARLQKIITVTLAIAALGWMFVFWPESPLVALAGFFLILLGYAAFLGVEFVLLRFVNRRDPAPQAHWSELLSAWWAEVRIAPRIFFGRQPFLSNTVADHLEGPALHGRRGVVFVHGFFCNRGFWTPWLRRLQPQDRAFVAVNLEPIFGSIEDYAPLIDAAVRQVERASGLPPLVVCHSMGGLAARFWMKSLRAEARVHGVVTIGTPHRGTWLARFGRGINGTQMRLDCEWQVQLAQGFSEDGLRKLTCWYSNCDNIVFPSTTATLPGADNRLVRSAAHIQLAFLPEVMDGTLSMLKP